MLTSSFCLTKELSFCVTGGLIKQMSWWIRGGSFHLVIFSDIFSEANRLCRTMRDGHIIWTVQVYMNSQRKNTQNRTEMETMFLREVSVYGAYTVCTISQIWEGGRGLFELFFQEGHVLLNREVWNPKYEHHCFITLDKHLLLINHDRGPQPRHFKSKQVVSLIPNKLFYDKRN